MRDICITLIYSFFLTFTTTACTKKNEIRENETFSTCLKEKSDCEKMLYQLFDTSNFEKKEKYEIRVDEIRNDTIIIKVFTRNNLSDDAQINESAVGWFIIPPKKDALYLSLNALDPIEPNFKKVKTKESYFKGFLSCINSNKTNDMKNEIKFTDLFNEGTNIEFTPSDLNKDTPEIKDFKKKLETYLEETLPEDFNNENLSYLINNETFFDLQYYTNSAWLQYFITRYKIDVTQLIDLMNQAITQEDYNAVKTLIDNHYIVSENDLQISTQTGHESKNKIRENNKDDYESYIVSNSKISKIELLLKNSFSKNHIQDPDGFTNLRKSTTTSSEVLQKIKSGEHIDVLDNYGDWFLVKTKEGKTGYVHKSKIKSS